MKHKFKPLPLLTRVSDDDDDISRRPLELKLFGRMFRYTAPYKKNLRWLIAMAGTRAVQGPVLLWLQAAIIISGPIKSGDSRMLWIGVAGYTALVVFT